MEQYGGGDIDFADGQQVKKLRRTNTEHTQTDKEGQTFGDILRSVRYLRHNHNSRPANARVVLI